MNYDYRAGKERIENILSSEMEIIPCDTIPSDEGFTFENAYSSIVTAIFIDIRQSTKIFSDNAKISTAKMIRSFTSEIIEILTEGNNTPREIGIRGDCVYAIFSSGTKDVDWEIFQKGEYINTYMKMLNKLLIKNRYSTIKVGIGISTSKEIVVKAGRKGKKINDLVWIGKCVSQASKYSGYGNKDCLESMVVSKTIYNNIIDLLKKNNPDKAESRIDLWFSPHQGVDTEDYYSCDIIKSEFNDWVDNGMED